MEKVLELVFKDAAGKQKVLKVNGPKDDISAQSSRQAMEALIAADVFTSAGGSLKEAVEARLRTTQVNVLK